MHALASHNQAATTQESRPPCTVVAAGRLCHLRASGTEFRAGPELLPGDTSVWTGYAPSDWPVSVAPACCHRSND
ncbi:hypothetical protein GCM10019017_24330 [Streptomyces showdoensis]